MKITSHVINTLKKSSIFLVGLLLLTTSCEEVDDLTKFDIEYEKSFTVGAAVNIGEPVSVSTPDITTKYEEKFSGNDTEKDLVEKIFMKELVLSLQSPEESDLSFLESLTIYINAEGMQQTEIATKESISDDVGTTIKMETSKTDLKEYIFKDSFNLRVKVTTDETFTQDHEINAAMVFTVDAEVL
jgi:hypothetical protein